MLKSLLSDGLAVISFTKVTNYSACSLCQRGLYVRFSCLHVWFAPKNLYVPFVCACRKQILQNKFKRAVLWNNKN